MGKRRSYRKSVKKGKKSNSTSNKVDVECIQIQELNNNELDRIDNYRCINPANCVGDVKNDSIETNTYFSKLELLPSKNHELSAKIVDVQNELDIQKPFQKLIYKVIEKSKKLANIIDNNDFINQFPRKDLKHLCREAAKLHKTGEISSVPSDKLGFILDTMDRIISPAINIIISNSQDNVYKLTTESDPVFKAMNASLLTLYVWTAPRIDQRAISDDEIENVVTFIKLATQKIILPAFDSNYKLDSCGADSIGTKKLKKKKMEMLSGELQMYNDLYDVLLLLNKFIREHTLTDFHLLTLNSICVSAFFVENTESIQLALLKVVGCIFSKYQHHRKLLLDDILLSMVKSGNRQSEIYKLENGERIQMHSALLMTMIQSIVYFSKDSLKPGHKEGLMFVIDEKLKEARLAALYLMRNFFAKCCSKLTEGCRLSLSTLVRDLLLTFDNSEWPVSEMMLHMLVRVLFENHSASENKRLFSLELLTNIYCTLKKHTANYEENKHKIDEVIHLDVTPSKTKEPNQKCEEPNNSGHSSEKVHLLQKAILDFIADRERTDPEIIHAKHLHLANWFTEMLASQENDTTVPEKSPKQQKTVKRKSQSTGRKRKCPKGKSPATKSDRKQPEKLDSKMKFLVESFHGIESKKAGLDFEQTNQSFIDVDVVQLIVHNFTLKRPLLKSFNAFVNLVLRALSETSTQVRLKSIRCLSELIVGAPDLLSVDCVYSGIKASIYDTSIAIRECAIDIMSKIMPNSPEVVDSYIDIFSKRILDTGVSVRKKVIKILGEVCTKFPNKQNTPEIVAKIMYRINDEPGVRSMVLDFFYKYWFTPIDSDSIENLSQRTSSIVNVIIFSMKTGLDSFEQILMSLINPKKDYCDARGLKNVSADDVLLSCQQIVDELVKLVFDVTCTSENVLAGMAALFLFAKNKPELFVRHADTMEKLLCANYQSQDIQLVIYILQTLKLIIPNMRYPSCEFVSDLENIFGKIIVLQKQAVVENCIPCVQVLTNLTKNYKFVGTIMKNCYGYLLICRSNIEENNSLGNSQWDHLWPKCKRALLVVGLLMRHFNFCDENVCSDNVPLTITRDVAFMLDFFLRTEDRDLKFYAVSAIGNVCIRFYKLMTQPGIQGHYCKFLKEDDVHDNLKIQVLNNLRNYLIHDGKRQEKEFLNWNNNSKNDSIKIMEDVKSGLSSGIIQTYLPHILELTLHKQPPVRRAAQILTHIILQQGLVNPIKLIPYLISMTTEDDDYLRFNAKKHLQYIEERYGLILMKFQSGLEMAFRLQVNLRLSMTASSPYVHGFREGRSDGTREAHFSFVYSLLKKKAHKRALLSFILRRFEEQSSDSTMLRFLTDNLAYLDYSTIDETLFVIHNIDVFLSVYGTNIIQTFEEALLPTDKMKVKPHDESKMEESDEECVEEDEEELLKRLPNNTQPLKDCLQSTHGCLLLMSLKQYLKNVFNISDCMMLDYSPLETSKALEKPAVRKKPSPFDGGKIQPYQDFSELDESENVRSSLITNFIEFKRLIMEFDFSKTEDRNSQIL